MEEKDCKVCKKLVKEKYKNYKTWKVLAIVFIFLSVVLAVLYFASGDMFVKETVENNIEIENGNGVNENSIITGSGSTISGTVETQSNIGIFILIGVVILTGGIVGGCYIVSHKKDKE